MNGSDEGQRVIRRAGTVGFYTVLSRVTGLLRDVAIAHAFGTRLAADAFFVAFRIPNLLRRLFAEGALTVSFVPVFSQSLKRSREEAKETVDLSFTLTLVVLAGVSVLGILLSPWLIRLTAWGFTGNPAKFDLTVTLTRVMFPYLLLVSLAALAMGVLNSLKHFAVPAASSIFMNLGVIGGAVFFIYWFDPPVLGLAIGVLAGGFLQFAIHLPVMKRLKFLPRIRWSGKGFAHPDVKKIVGMMGPAAYGAAVYQFNVILITLLASFLPSGSVSYLWYADRVMEFPLGVFGIAMATALLPSLSDHAAPGQREEFKRLFHETLRMTLFITIPAAVGLIVLARPIVHVLFERGSFLAESTHHTAWALVFFSLGLPFISAVRVTANAFYSLQDARTPVRCANGAVVVNGLLALLLMHPMRHNGLALSVSVASAFNLALQLFYLRKKIGRLGLRRVGSGLIPVTTATLIMGAVIRPFIPRAGTIPGLALILLAGTVVYLLLALLLRSPEAGLIGRQLFSRRRGGG